ncbi:MAG: CHASE2 domain-containing protein [Gemmatimonadota bacterium]
MARLASRSKLTVLATSLVIAYAAALISSLASLLGPLRRAEEATLDWRYLLRGSAAVPSEDIVLVAVEDDAGLACRVPLPTAHLAQVVAALSRGGARLVGLDVLLDTRTGDSEGDALLREAIGGAGNVVLASALVPAADGRSREVRAAPYFGERALDYGYADFPASRGPEPLREARIALESERGGHALSLVGCLYARLRELDTGSIRRLDWSQRDRRLPGSDEEYRQLIDFSGPPFCYYRQSGETPPAGIPRLSSHQLLARAPAEIGELVAGRTVLVGPGFEEGSETYLTPFSTRGSDWARADGVEVQAQLLRSLLEPERLERSGLVVTALVVVAAAWLGGLASVGLSPLRAAAYTAVGLLLLWVAAYSLFAGSQLVVPVIAPSLAGILSCLCGVVYVETTDGRRQREVRDRFGSLVDGRQMKQILAHPEMWTTEVDERPVSVLWAAMERAEAKPEEHPAPEMPSFYQRWYQVAADLVHQHGGAIFRYEEDGLAAVFGAPLPDAQHAAHAVLAAIDVAEGWLTFTKKWDAAGAWRLSLGADTGHGVLGELGGRGRSAYRVLGDPVVRARALATAQRGQELHISQAMLDQVGDQVAAVPVEGSGAAAAYRVEGRAAAMPIGAADQPPHPFWKYLGLIRPQEDPVSEEFLSGLPLFDDISRGNLRRIRRLLHFRSYKAGERIFTRGEVGSAMYVIQRGAVDILHEGDGQRKPVLLQRLRTGEFFGELALLSSLRRSASAVAYESSELLVMFQADLYELLELEPELGGQLLRTLSQILGERVVRINEELARLQGAKQGPA